MRHRLNQPQPLVARPADLAAYGAVGPAWESLPQEKGVSVEESNSHPSPMPVRHTRDRRRGHLGGIRSSRRTRRVASCEHTFSWDDNLGAIVGRPAASQQSPNLLNRPLLQSGDPIDRHGLIGA